MRNNTLVNGDLVKHVIHGFQGVVIGEVTYLTGCRQLLVLPEKLDNGQPPEAQWYDDCALELVKAGKFSGITPYVPANSPSPYRGGIRNDLPSTKGI